MFRSSLCRVARTLIRIAFVTSALLSAQAQGVTATASGTYTWNSATGVTTGTWTSSDFTCDGPNLGTDTTAGVTVTATSITGLNNGLTWSRLSGTAGDVVGTWTATERITGNSYTLVVNADGTMSVVGNIISCGYGGGQNPYAFSQHWSDGYNVSLGYSDSPKPATAASVIGPGITGSEVLTYSAAFGSWNSWTSPSTQVFFGTSYPAGLPFTYTFAITDSTGTRTFTSTVSCFQQQFVTSISPKGNVYGTPTFNWTGIADPSAVYGVEVSDSTNNQIWHTYNVSGTSTAYSGPALTPGMTYGYNVLVMSSAACRSGVSFARGSFTYVASGGDTSLPTIPPSTPLPPPPIVQSVYTAPSGQMPTAAVSVTPSGTFGNATLVVTLDLSKVLSGGSFAAQGQFAAGYNIYVAALVPKGALGLASATWFMYPASRAWAELGSPITAYREGLAQNATDKVVITILSGLDVTGLVGAEIYIGYGTTDTEMLTASRYRGVYKVQ